MDEEIMLWGMGVCIIFVMAAIGLGFNIVSAAIVVFILLMAVVVR